MSEPDRVWKRERERERGERERERERVGEEQARSLCKVYGADRLTTANKRCLKADNMITDPRANNLPSVK